MLILFVYVVLQFLFDEMMMMMTVVVERDTANGTLPAEREVVESESHEFHRKGEMIFHVFDGNGNGNGNVLMASDANESHVCLDSDDCH